LCFNLTLFFTGFYFDQRIESDLSTTATCEENVTPRESSLSFHDELEPSSGDFSVMFVKTDGTTRKWDTHSAEIMHSHEFTPMKDSPFLRESEASGTEDSNETSKKPFWSSWERSWAGVLEK
jgi:hypothetical protein